MSVFPIYYLCYFSFSKHENILKISTCHFFITITHQQFLKFLHCTVHVQLILKIIDLTSNNNDWRSRKEIDNFANKFMLELALLLVGLLKWLLGGVHHPLSSHNWNNTITVCTNVSDATYLSSSAICTYVYNSPI